MRNTSDSQYLAGMATLLTPHDHVLLLIDHQPQMAFGVQSIDRQTLLNNTLALAKSARAFNVPTVLTTVAAASFSGPLWPELQAVFPHQTPIDRTTMNSWEDPKLVEAVKAHGKRRLVIAALWTEVCLAFPTIDALREGFEVFIVTDASGATTTEAQNVAVMRMVQAGAQPITWLQYLLELQRDWARAETYEVTTGIAKEHAGAYGIGIRYAKAMLGEHASEAGPAH